MAVTEFFAETLNLLLLESILINFILELLKFELQVFCYKT